MVKKNLFISLALFGLLFSTMPRVCFADVSAQLEQAETYKTQGQYEQAEQIYQQIVTDFPDSNDALEAQKQLTLIYIAWSKWPQAEAAFQELLAGFSGHKDIAQAVHDIAYQYRLLKKYDKANQLDQYVVDNWPQSDYAVLAQMDLTKYYVDQGNDTAAQAAIDKLLANFSNSPLIARAVHDVAQHYRWSGKYERANELYQHVIDNWPKAEHALWAEADLIKSYLALGDDPNAQAAVEQLLANFTDSPLIARVVWDTARVYRDSKKYEKANQLYQHVTENWPKTEHALWSQTDMIKLHTTLGNDAEAQAAVDKLLTDFSENPLIARTVWDTGQYYRELKKYEKANELYQHVIDNWPDSEHAMWSQADLIKSNVALGDDVAAQAAIDKLVTNFTDNPLTARAVWDTGQLYRGLKKYQKANELYQHTIDNWPKAEHAMWAEADLIKSYVALGDDPNAQAAVDKLLANFTDSPLIARAVWDTARVYRDSKKYEKANDLYQHVIDNYPQAEHAILSQMGAAELNVLSLIDSGNDIAAQAALDNLIADFNDHPALPQGLFSIAIQCFYRHNYPRAIELWEFILSEHPQSPLNSEIPYLLATCYRQLEDNAQAIKYYKQTVEEYPDSRYAHRAAYRIALIYRFAGEYDNALYWLERQRELYPDRRLQAQRALMEQAAVYYLNLKDYEKGTQAYQQYITEYPDQERALVAYHCLARCYEKMGNTDQAIAVLEEALQKFPGKRRSEEIAEELQRLREGGEK